MKMTDRNKSPEIAMGLSSYLSWKLYRTVIHEALVCPRWILWEDYKEYCKCWGFKTVEFQQWTDELEDHPELTVRRRDGKYGRLKVAICGIGVVAEHMTQARRMPDIFGSKS